MGTGERIGPNMGPFVNAGQQYSNGLEAFAKRSEPVLKGVGRCNLEAMRLTTRRARAWIELPSRVSRCKTPQDLVREQLQFWQTAALDYAEGMQRLTLAFAALAESTWVAPQKGDAARARDYMTFPEGNESAQEAPERERRAA